MAKSVLIAESNKVFSETMAGALSLLGFVVVGTTPKRSEVAALAQETKPDLLIFDCHMLAGETAIISDLQHLKEQLPKIKIIALGCHENFEGVLERFLNVGFHGYWNKYDDWAGFLKQLGILFP
jgi:DNA-binding NarL/FixJ family response regulator